MNEQNYSNHRRWVPMYHFVAALLILALIIGSIVNLIKSIGADSGVYSASLIVVIVVVLAILHYYMRTFALKAQDRAIRVEENLRHYIMNGKLLDPKLDIRQIIGIRFASDDEYLELEQKAVEENMRENDIKKAVKNWKGDYYRA